MSYVIDPRKNWALAEKRLAEEPDARRRQILATLVAHAKAEASADFDALMATVAPTAHYRSYATDDPAMTLANSPEGKEAVAAYYQGIVASGCHLIEHAVERLVVGRDAITSEGLLKMAYPGAVLALMGIEVPDPEAHYLYQQRLLIVWEFDDEGLVLCEDSYAAAGGAGFEGIAERPIRPDAIYRIARPA
jgi:hypothetical protein